MKLLKFTATWCNPCKQMSSVLAELDIPHEIEEIDVDNNYPLSVQYSIRGVPTLIAVNKSNEEIGRLVGSHPRGVVSTWLDSVK